MSSFAAEDRYKVARQTYGNAHFGKVESSKVLVVGAGGIGCEILKNLVMMGFKSIELIDLDTIDVSNLNRQFLFRPQHVGQPKANVAAAAVMEFNADVAITAHYANIKDEKFNISYFKSFSIVLNALDNVEARKHVNRMCLAAKVPLIDSGTTGYLGQVTSIFGGITTCYECEPKEGLKSYAICTIRATPDKPVHCIVWAKECFKLLFNQPSESVLNEESTNQGDDGVATDDSTYMRFVRQFNGRQLPGLADADLLLLSYDLLHALYVEEINKLIAMDKYVNAEKTPVAIPEQQLVAALASARAALVSGEEPAHRKRWDRPSTEDCLAECLLTMCSLYRDADLGSLSFDKDDAAAMRFVHAASELRCQVFNITRQSYHECKGIAGNIIPAIATSNAIVAAMQVLQALKLLNVEGELTRAVAHALCPHGYLCRKPTRKGLLFQPMRPPDQKKTCYVCARARIVLQIDTEQSTLQFLVDEVLKKKLAFNEPTVQLGHDMIYEEGDGAELALRANLPKKLCLCPGGGVRDERFLTVSDFSQDLDVEIVIKHKSNERFDEEKAAVRFAVTVEQEFSSAAAGGSAGPQDDEDVVVAEAAPAVKKQRVD